eukprot:gene26029-29401_t
MSARKSKVVKSAETSAQYGSKFVAGALDNRIAQKLNRCKYPKAHSCLTFPTSPTTLATNVSALKANIAALQEKVQAQRAHIKQLLVAEEKETSASLAQRLPSGHAPYEAGQFADSAGRIGAQFGEVAKLLLEVTNDIESRNAVLEGNLSIAASKLPAVLQAMEQRHAESAKVTGSAAGSTAGNRGTASAKKGASVAASSSNGNSVSNKDAIQQVHKLFGKK